MATAGGNLAPFTTHAPKAESDVSVLGRGEALASSYGKDRQPNLTNRAEEWRHKRAVQGPSKTFQQSVAVLAARMLSQLSHQCATLSGTSPRARTPALADFAWPAEDRSSAGSPAYLRLHCSSDAQC